MIGSIRLLPRLIGFLLPCFHVLFVGLAHARMPFDAARPYDRTSWPCGDAFCRATLICDDRRHLFSRLRFGAALPSDPLRLTVCFLRGAQSFPLWFLLQKLFQRIFVAILEFLGIELPALGVHDVRCHGDTESNRLPGIHLERPERAAQLDLPAIGRLIGGRGLQARARPTGPRGSQAHRTACRSTSPS
jgi:hypothetical protein